MDKRRKKSKKKMSVMLVAYLVLMTMLIVGTTLALLTSKTGDVDNTFTPSEVTSEVVEDFNGKIKSNVQIKNTGNTTAYIRAKVIITWKDNDGNVYGKAPEAGADYSIKYDLNNGWEKASDGFYYWTKPVKSDDESSSECSTGVLITSCEQLKGAPADGYHLNVEIIGSAIQSLPTNVVTTEWSSGVASVNSDGTLNIK